MSTGPIHKFQNKSNLPVQLRPNQLKNKHNHAKVRQISTVRPLSPELRILMFLQQSSSICSVFLITVVLTIFGLTVCIPQLWDKEYKKLKILQRNERQLTATNESLKNKLIQQVETPQNGLVYPKPDSVLFLSPPTKELKKPSQESIPENKPLFNDSPLAY